MTVRLADKGNFRTAFYDSMALGPDRPAVILLREGGPSEGETLTYRMLGEEAERRARWLRTRLPVGSRVVLALPTSRELVVDFVGCLLAGMVAVPLPEPESSAEAARRFASVLRDSGAGLVLARREDLPGTDPKGISGPPLSTPAAPLPDGDIEVAPEDLATPGPADPVVLQYTSGSTGDPKGVVVTGGSMLANVDAYSRQLGLGPGDRFGGWLPLHHDMGLFALLGAALLLGGSCALMPPTAFLKRPAEWLAMMDRHSVTVTAAPNFALDMCIRGISEEAAKDIDLSRLRLLINGSEPIHAPVMTGFMERFARNGFRPEAMCPGYGLAEVTVYVTSSPPDAMPRVIVADNDGIGRGELILADEGRQLVSCDVSVGLTVRIVDPATHEALPEDRIGEIWLRGPSVTAGYWGREDVTRETFGHTTADGETGWLRTGDLGALHEGEIYVTGRQKEVLIVHGRNVWPQDLEAEAREAHDALAGLVGAAFSVLAPDERPVLVHEVRPGLDEAALTGVVRTVQRHISRAMGVSLGNILLVRRGQIRRTTSGKIQRGVMRQRLLAGELRIVHAKLEPGVRALLDEAARGTAPELAGEAR
ncbi:fatty acyl-AMP ligase [Streptomyces hoynatensis]|nr:fatty acyl-AMP ligase [Streptomyces hoynatensis]